MFSSLQELFIKFLGLDQLHEQLAHIESRLKKLEDQHRDYSTLQFYIDEAERMYQEDLVKLQEEKEIQEAIIQSAGPPGEA